MLFEKQLINGYCPKSGGLQGITYLPPKGYIIIFFFWRQKNEQRNSGFRNKGSREMKITWKTFLAVSAYWAGVFGWFYIGVWQVLKKPVYSVILAQVAGHLSIGLLIGALIQGFLYLSLAGGIWCVGYMISEYFKESK